MRQWFVHHFPVRTTAALLWAAVLALSQPDPNAYYQELLGKHASHFSDCLQPSATGAAHSTNIALVLDASGTTQSHVTGGVTLDVLRTAASRFAASLASGTNVAIIVYGHHGDMTLAGKDASCRAIETVYPTAPYQASLATPVLDALKPGGWTPLKAAIEKAGDAFAGVSDNFTNNTIYVLAAGMDTCGGRAIEAARAAHAERTRTTLHVVSIGTSKSEQEELKSVAQAGGGTFAAVQGAPDLQKYFTEQARTVRDVHRQNRLDASCVETHLTEERSAFQHAMSLNPAAGKSTVDTVNAKLRLRQTRVRRWIETVGKHGDITPELLDRDLGAIR